MLLLIILTIITIIGIVLFFTSKNVCLRLISLFPIVAAGSILLGLLIIAGNNHIGKDVNYMNDMRHDLVVKLENIEIETDDIEDVCHEVESFNKIINSNQQNIDSPWIGKIFSKTIAQTEKINIDDYISVTLNDTKNTCNNCKYECSKSFKYCPECGTYLMDKNLNN